MKSDPDQHGNSCGNSAEQSPRPSGSVGGCVGTTHTTGTGAESLFNLLGYRRPAWMADALCKEYRHLDFTVERGRVKDEAMQVCGRCAVMAECRAYAVGEPDLIGVFGGTDSAARRAMRRNRPGVEGLPCP